jgi:hypothetical protein
MAAKGHIKTIEICKERLIEKDFVQIFDGFTGVTKLIRNKEHLETYQKKKEKVYYAEPIGHRFGHIFQVKITIDFILDEKPSDGNDSGCCLEWWERPTKPYARLNTNAWNQIYKEEYEGPTNSIFHNWWKTVREVENAGTKTVKILDRPNLGEIRQSKDILVDEIRRALYFCIVAKCTKGCECGQGYKVATAIQGLKVDPIGEKNYFFRAYPAGEFVNYDGKEPVNFNAPAFVVHQFE